MNKPTGYFLKVLSSMPFTVSKEKAQELGFAPTFHPHAFPDIRANGFGVEVKTTNRDHWLAVGNSIFEGMRDSALEWGAGIRVSSKK